MSDIHLGSKICRADKILEVLRNTKFEKLIVNGDLFDSDTTYRLTDRHWEVLSTLSAIAEHKDVTLVGGNHGRELDLIARKMNIEVMNEYAFEVGGRHFLCLHGDEFDGFTRHLPGTTKMFSGLFNMIQRRGNDQQRFSMFLKRLSKRVMGTSRRQRRLALKRGARDHVDVVICSHTHMANVAKKDGVLFVNSGSFCDDPSTYIAINSDGLTRLEEI